MAWYKIADLLGGAVPVGTAVTVKGWVRTRRDSKAGLSFLHVHDGTCFDPIQAVVPSVAAQLPGRGPAADDRLLGGGRRHAGRRRRARARRSRSRRRRSASSAGSTTPTPTRSRPSATPSSTCARWRTCGRAPTRSARWRASATAGAGHPPLLPRARLLLGPHADHHGQRRRGRRRDVPRLDARPREPAAHAGRAASTSRRTSSASRRSSPCRASSTSRPTAWRSAASTPSGRPSGPRTPTPAATWPSSG